MRRRIVEVKTKPGPWFAVWWPRFGNEFSDRSSNRFELISQSSSWIYSLESIFQFLAHSQHRVSRCSHTKPIFISTLWISLSSWPLGPVDPRENRCNTFEPRRFRVISAIYHPPQFPSDSLCRRFFCNGLSAGSLSSADSPNR